MKEQDNFVESIDYKDCVIKIYQDWEPLNPREFNDCLGTILLPHKRYDLSDKPYERASYFYKTDFWGELLDGNIYEYFTNEELHDDFWTKHLPAYLDKRYVYIGLSLKTYSGSDPIYLREDSGGFDVDGVLFVHKDKVIEEYGDFSDSSKEKALKCLRAELLEFAAYLRGEVYGYEILVEDEDYGSCWGFYVKDSCIEYAKETIDACKDDIDKLRWKISRDKQDALEDMLLTNIVCMI